MQKVRGLSAKVHHPTIVKVQYAKRTSPYYSGGNSSPNTYMICHIWIRMQICRSSGGYVQKHHEYFNAYPFDKMDCTILFSGKNCPKSIYDTLYLGQGSSLCKCAKCQGVKCKITSSPDKPGSEGKMISTMMILRKIYPTFIYDMSYLG